MIIASEQSENQNHLCQHISGLCMKIGCDANYCQLCFKNSHSKHKKNCKYIEDVEQILQIKLNQNQQLISDLEILQQKVLNINLFFQNQIEAQQQEINQILQWIKDLQFNEIQNKIHMIREIYHNDNNNIKSIYNYRLEYIEQIRTIEMQWSQRIQLLMSQKEKNQKIYFLSDDSDFTSSSSEQIEEAIENDQEDQQQQDNFKIKQFSLVQQQDPNQQQNDFQEIQNQKNKEQKDDEQQQLQQLEENPKDEDFSWKLLLSENLFQEAYVLKFQNNFNEAIQKLNESLEYFPNNLEALKLKGYILFKQDKYLEVIKNSDLVIKQDKRDEQPYFEKGLSLKELFIVKFLLNLDRFHEAIQCFDELISMSPSQELPYHYKAKCLIKLQKYEQAIDCAKKTLQTQNSEKKFIAFQYIGESLYHLKRYEEALDYVILALNLNQRDFKINKLYCYILIHLKQFEAALQSSESFSDLHSWQVILLQSSILRWLKRFDEALVKCQQVININPYDMLVIKEKSNISNYQDLIQSRNSQDKTILFQLAI